MNNVGLDRKRDCSSCFACSAVCKVGAITIHQDKYGFYKPVINDNLCIGCGICKNVCYSHLDFQDEKYSLNGYYGWHKDSDVVKASSSGGITTAIAQTAIADGYLVIGCGYSISEHKAKHIIVRRQEDIGRILGSKYFQSDLSEILTEVNKMPRDTKMVFFGTPCQVLGFKKMLIINRFNLNNIVLVELFCHGIVSQTVWQSYMLQTKINDANCVRFRTKTYGWHVPANEFVTDKKVINTAKSGDDFFSAYYSKEFFNQSCYSCQVKRILNNGDLRIGDFWGERFAKNKKGVSCVLSSSSKGEQILEKCKPLFSLFSVPTEEILRAQSYNTNHSFDENEWNENYELLCNLGLKHSLKNINKKKPLAQRITRAIYIRISNIRSKFITFTN